MTNVHPHWRGAGRPISAALTVLWSSTLCGSLCLGLLRGVLGQFSRVALARPVLPHWAGRPARTVPECLACSWRTNCDCWCTVQVCPARAYVSRSGIGSPCAAHAQEAGTRPQSFMEGKDARCTSLHLEPYTGAATQSAARLYGSAELRPHLRDGQ